MKILDELPEHLKKYIVTQDPQNYSYKEKAVWRLILNQLTRYLKIHAHEFYCEGMEKTGLSAEEIPDIQKLSLRLQKFGWNACPVSGFIPPAAFMELQAYAILPIASDLRSLDHLLYTPAPDIVHEAAGHAPFLAHPEYAQYLQTYAQVAKNALINKSDLEVYQAIRILSDLKEHPDSSAAEIAEAEKNLRTVSNCISEISEATYLSRMNWWTAEYGLIGDLNNPKIYGAGLLSSVGESKHCLSNKVKKLELNMDCIQYGYDITEQQPQLFVTPSFKYLSAVLDELAAQMAYRQGGLVSLKKLIASKTVNTVSLNSGLQISGVLDSFKGENNILFLKFSGKCQLAFAGEQIMGQGIADHPQGFSSPIGLLKNNDRCLSDFQTADWQKLGIEISDQKSTQDFYPIKEQTLQFEFRSGIILKGTPFRIYKKGGKNILMTFKNAEMKLADEILFQPDWGLFDLALGSEVSSVSGGPADRLLFGGSDDFPNLKVKPKEPIKKDSPQFELDQFYKEVRKLRTDLKANPETQSAAIDKISQKFLKQFPTEWLLGLEIYELIKKSKTKNFEKDILGKLKSADPEMNNLIQDSLKNI